MARADPTVLIAGHVTHDLYGHVVAAGGGAFYGARTYLGLGARVRLATAVGEDFGADAALAGLDVMAARAGMTTVFTNTYLPGGGGFRRAQRVGAVAPPVVPERLPAELRETALLHLAPVLSEIDLARWLGSVRARIVGIGVQGWVRRAGEDGIIRPLPWDAESLSGVDVACVGEDDLVGQDDLLDRLVATVPIVAFTHGDRGSEIIQRGRTTRLAAYPTCEVDPTGAGDTFAAGFLLGLTRGLDPIDSARLGAAAASIVVEARGGDALDRISEAPARALELSRIDHSAE